LSLRSSTGAACSDQLPRARAFEGARRRLAMPLAQHPAPAREQQRGRKEEARQHAPRGRPSRTRTPRPRVGEAEGHSGAQPGTGSPLPLRPAIYRRRARSSSRLPAACVSQAASTKHQDRQAHQRHAGKHELRQHPGMASSSSELADNDSLRLGADADTCVPHSKLVHDGGVSRVPEDCMELRHTSSTPSCEQHRRTTLSVPTTPNHQQQEARMRGLTALCSAPLRTSSLWPQQMLSRTCRRRAALRGQGAGEQACRQAMRRRVQGRQAGRRRPWRRLCAARDGGCRERDMRFCRGGGRGPEKSDEPARPFMASQRLHVPLGQDAPRRVECRGNWCCSRWRELTARMRRKRRYARLCALVDVPLERSFPLASFQQMYATTSARICASMCCDSLATESLRQNASQSLSLCSEAGKKLPLPASAHPSIKRAGRCVARGRAVV
jgi:hypothetical protein